MAFQPMVYIDAQSFTQFQFPVVVTGMNNQLKKLFKEGVCG